MRPRSSFAIASMQRCIHRTGPTARYVGELCTAICKHRGQRPTGCEGERFL